MSNIRLDHFITGTNADNIDTYLDEYRKAGFAVREHTVRHDPGLRNGFVSFGPEYLEFVWVEDEQLFDQGADYAMFKPHLRTLRAGHRPFGIGIDTDDIQALHDELAARGMQIPPVIEGRPRGAAADSPPVWSFQPIPPPAVEGLLCFALAYHTGRKDGTRKITLAPNTTYAISGLTFASNDPSARAMAWRDLLAPGEGIMEKGGIFEVYTRPHTITWMTPIEYQEQYGLSYKSSPHPFGEIALINMLAQDLDKAEEMITAAGRSAARFPDKRTGADTLLVPPDERDGFTFAITQFPIEEWLSARVAATGEKLALASPE